MPFYNNDGFSLGFLDIPDELTTIPENQLLEDITYFPTTAYVVPPNNFPRFPPTISPDMITSQSTQHVYSGRGQKGSRNHERLLRRIRNGIRAINLLGRSIRNAERNRQEGLVDDQNFDQILESILEEMAFAPKATPVGYTLHEKPSSSKNLLNLDSYRPEALSTCFPGNENVHLNMVPANITEKVLFRRYGTSDPLVQLPQQKRDLRRLMKGVRSRLCAIRYFCKVSTKHEGWFCQSSHGCPMSMNLNSSNNGQSGMQKRAIQKSTKNIKGKKDNTSYLNDLWKPYSIATLDSSNHIEVLYPISPKSIEARKYKRQQSNKKAQKKHREKVRQELQKFRQLPKNVQEIVCCTCKDKLQSAKIFD